MDELTESRKAKERSPNFPFISLQAALDRAQVFYAQEKRGSAPLPVAAEHWGYRPSSSGALQTAAALKSYGLMIDEGAGSNRKLKLTDLALRILLDMRPDDTDRKRYMRQAALTPSVCAEIYGKWPDGLPSDATLNHYLVLELGFNQSTALRAVGNIIDNERLTKSSSEESQSYSKKIVDSGLEPLNAMDQLAQQIISPEADRFLQTVSNKAALVRTERVIDPDGLDVLLQFNGQPTIASYEFLKDYIELRIKALRRADVLTNKDKA
jgi:hypothetical protein